jgi:hypothetical protein
MPECSLLYKDDIGQNTKINVLCPVPQDFNYREATPASFAELLSVRLL